MFESIQQQAGMSLLRSVAKEATRGALPYPEEPVPDADKQTSPGLFFQVRRLAVHIRRALPRRSRVGQPHPARG